MSTMRESLHHHDVDHWAATFLRALGA